MAVNLMKHMKNTTLSAEGFESTYALIVRSEEKERNLFEGVAYLVFILSAVFSIWQVAQQPAPTRPSPVLHATSITQPADPTHRA
jgi:hypothetical protein